MEDDVFVFVGVVVWVGSESVDVVGDFCEFGSDVTGGESSLGVLNNGLMNKILKLTEFWITSSSGFVVRIR